MTNKTGDTIALMACGLGALSMLGFLPAHDTHPAIPVLPRSHPAGLVAVAHAAAPVRPHLVVRSVAPLAPPLPKKEVNLGSTATAVLPVPVATATATTLALVANPGVLLHAPSVSVPVIAAELAAAGAPFAGETWAGKSVAQYIYDAAVWWGLDPAMVLAFMHHESRYGTAGMATSTKGPCNIRPSGNQPSLNNYRTYSTWQEGIDDCIRLLGRYGRDYGHNDLGNAINTWAPSVDFNNVPAYIASVEQTVSRLNAESK